MSSFSEKEKPFPFNSAPANRLASQSQATSTQQQQFPIRSQSQSPQQKQQLQPIYPWSAHSPLFGQSPSPFLRFAHALSTTATAAGELFLFGGYVPSSNSASNDLYAFSTRDFSTTLLETSGQAPNPRYGHGAVFTSTILLIWGGIRPKKQGHDDSLYLLNLVSREWTRVVVNGPRPCGRSHHTMTLVGSKLFVFGGQIASRCFNDIWAFDLNCLKLNPFWESYEPTPGSEKPLPRYGHVSVPTGDRIIIFGGGGGGHYFNDTWSFNISTRNWTKLQCTGPILSPRVDHAAVLVDDVMYVFGGRAIDRTRLGDLTALNLLTQQWTTFQDIEPSPCGRCAHAMASDGRRVFVLGGELSPGAQVDEAKLIHVLDTKLLIFPKPDSNSVKRSEKTTQLAQRLSAGHPTQGRPQQRIFSSSDAGAAHGAFPFQIVTSKDIGRPASPQITRERDPSPNGLPSQPTGVDDKPRHVREEDDDSGGPTEHLGKLVAPDTSEKEVVCLEHERVIELERQLLVMRAAQTERDRRIAQLTDELVQNNALLEQAEGNAAEAKKRARLEQRELQAKLDELLLSRDHTPEQAQSALQKATSRVAEANERSQQELAAVHAKLEARESELAAVRLQLTDAENRCAKSKAEADTLRAQTAVGLVNTDVDRVMHRLMELMRAMEGQMASLRGDEKSIEDMECRNEG